MRKILSFLVFSLVSCTLLAQFGGQPPVAGVKGVVKGKIVEDGTNTPLEYANVAIYSVTDSALAGGGIADANGVFEVKDIAPGKYFVDAKFIGYEHFYSGDFVINPKKNNIDIGIIKLEPAAENLTEVKVVAQETPIAYEIDKKVVDPSQFPTAANGTATDVLANTPSVVVDVEGNVTLRGSSDFTVLIDGRPTPFDAADALDQIPASTIRNIEIITNPSAKYDPDGNGGIININTKKSKLTGFSGIVNASYDSYGSLSGDFLFNYKLDKFNIFLSGNKGNWVHRGFSTDSTMTFSSDTIFTISNGDNEHGFHGWSVKTGFDYFINDMNSLTFILSVDGHNRSSGGTQNYHEYSSFYDLISVSERNSSGKSQDLSLSLDYKKKFATERQELTAYVYYERGNGEELSVYDQYDETETLIEGQKNWEDGDDNKFRVKVDYVHPFTDKMKLEAGYQARINRSFEWNDVHWYDETDDYEPSEVSEYYTESNFKRNIHAAYTTFTHGGDIWGYSVGLRTEHTDRDIDFSGSDDDNKIYRWDFFPSAHVSFHLPMQQQLIASYSRRIKRPRSYQLEPFLTYVDAYTVRMGNPAIEPEYINSYELGYQKQLNKGFLSAEVYHRKTINKIDRVRSVYSGNVMLRTIENIGDDFSTGLELMWNFKPTKWWSFNLMGNAYHYMIDSELYNSNRESFNWHARLGNTFSITKTTKLQVDGMYHSPSVSVQGTRESFAFTNIAVRQDFFDNKLNVTFNVKDVLNTAKFGMVSSDDDYYSKTSFDMDSPIFAITISYKLNNYHEKRKPNNNASEMMNMGNNGEEF